jgi:hypothetical protein
MGLTLYFVGAGLTKSLEKRTRSVPLMADFVQVLTEHAGNKVVRDTLVGMEVGNVYEAACNECLTLATALRGREQVTDEERDRFAKLVRNRPSESIEAIFQKVESMNPETPGSEIRSGFHDYFRYAINEVFATVGWDLQLDLLTGFLQRQFSQDAARSHIFVSFNYDLALDRAVGIASRENWQPRNGYGFEFPFYTVDAANASSAEGIPTGSQKIQILKPHGSLNWLRRMRNGVPPEGISGMVVPLESRWELDTGIHWDLRYWPTEPFKSVHFPDGVGASRVGIMIAPPSPTKPPIMPQLLSAESDAVSKADEVFVIGYSLPETDQDQWKLIDSAVRARAVPIPRLTIINYNWRPEDFQRICCLFRPRCVCTFNHGFAEFAARG